MKKIYFILLSLTFLVATGCEGDEPPTNNPSGDVPTEEVPSIPEEPETPENSNNPEDSEIKPPVSIIPETPASGVENGYEYVDLGLPSGTLWATKNIGAEKVVDSGDYFAWGETTTKTIYTWTYYKWGDGKDLLDVSLTKYCTSKSYGVVDEKTALEMSDDVARANWGGAWRVPTSEEIDELFNNLYCKWQYSSLNGILITSKINGNKIYLPYSGYKTYSNIKDSDLGYYWTSNINISLPMNAKIWLLTKSGSDTSLMQSRACGLTVRPVISK